MEQRKLQLKYRCRIFEVWEEEFLLPNKQTTKQSWINHKPTVAIVAVNDQNEIILIRQYRNAVKKNILEIPAGTMEDEESAPENCARRELAEETGYSAREIIKLFEGYLLPGYCNEYMYFFLARNLFTEPLSPDEDEFIEVVPTNFSKAKELLRSGEIIDAKTALGITLADNYLKTDRLFEK